MQADAQFYKVFVSGFLVLTKYKPTKLSPPKSEFAVQELLTVAQKNSDYSVWLFAAIQQTSEQHLSYAKWIHKDPSHWTSCLQPYHVTAAALVLDDSLPAFKNLSNDCACLKSNNKPVCATRSS